MLHLCNLGRVCYDDIKNKDMIQQMPSYSLHKNWQMSKKSWPIKGWSYLSWLQTPTAADPVPIKGATTCKKGTKQSEDNKVVYKLIMHCPGLRNRVIIYTWTKRNRNEIGKKKAEEGQQKLQQSIRAVIFLKHDHKLRMHKALLKTSRGRVWTLGSNWSNARWINGKLVF